MFDLFFNLFYTRMKTLTEVRNEVSAVQEALAVVQTDLQALIDADVVEEAGEGKPDPVVKLHVVTESGADTVFVPEVV